jgi:ABC-type lipoprotein export system ATPase subunit
MVNDMTGGKAVLVVGPEGSGKTFLSNMLRMHRRIVSHEESPWQKSRQQARERGTVYV